MGFSPRGFQGADLPALLAELARLETGEVVAGLVRDTLRPPSTTYGAVEEAPTEWRTTWFSAPDPEATLPRPQAAPVATSDVELGELIGGGRQGAVYAGRIRSTDTVVAVKVLYGGDGDETRAVREARVGAKVNHPNVLRVFRAERVRDFWVVVMEFLQGTDLARAGCSPDAAAPIVGQLADAVLSLANARVVHRDIKPANIVIRHADRAPVLVDFGLAVDMDALPAIHGPAGSPLYMAPEACSEWERPDPTWDAYALGMSAAAILAVPFPRGVSITELMVMKMSGEFDALIRESLASLPDQLKGWCSRLIGPPAGRMAQLEQIAGRGGT